MFKIRSARRQALLAGLVLLVLLSATAAVAVWRAQNDQDRQAAVDQRITVATALGEARAQFFIGATQLLIAAFADDPAPFIDSYRSTVPPVDNDLRQAREALVALNEPDGVALLDETAMDIGQIQQAIEGFLPTNLTHDRDTRLGLVIQYIPQMWPGVQTMMGNLEQLANGERSKLTDERAAAEQSSQITLGLLIGLCGLALLVAFGILSIFAISLLRPLSSLQASAKAITSGNWSVRAKVFGLEETASLAHDFNEMTDTLVERSAQLQESEQRFRNVLDVSRDFIYNLNLQTRTYDYVSPSVLPMSGFTPEEFTAMGFEGVWERFHPEDRERLHGLIERFLENTLGDDEVTATEYRWKRKDGEYYWLSDNSVLIRDPEGNPIALVGSARDITAQKQADEVLRESETRYRELFDGINSGVAVYEALADGEDFLIRDFGQAAERIEEITKEEIVGRKVTEVFPGVREMGLLDVLRRVWRTGTPEHHPISIYRDDRIAGWRENYVYKLPSGEIVALYEDVTEQRQAQEALRESEERFRTLAASAPIGIMMVDSEKGLVYCNERLLTIYGLSREEALGFGWVKSVHPDDREAFLAERSKAMAERREFVREFRIVTPQEEIRWIRVQTTPFLSQEGESNTRVGTVEDITERKMAEQTLRQSERRFRSLSDAAPIGIFLTDSQGNAIYANEHLLSLGGLTFEEGLGHTWIKVIHPDDREEALAAASRAVTERHKFSREFRILTKAGEERWVHATGTAIFSPEGIETGRVGTIEDITERKLAEDQKQKAFESVMLLLATAAEARDPYTERHLLRIKGYTEAIARELGLPPDEVRDIGLASLLHDLGKMLVPDSILTKPGPLSAEEWEIIKQHPVWGADLLSTHPWLETARQIALCHHERWNGTGYPEGLRGEDIPLGAAIVAVADAFDALLSDRPYKKAWPPRQATKEIQAQKGLMYSPEVVEAFNRALNAGEIKRVTAAPSADSLSGLSEAA